MPFALPVLPNQLLLVALSTLHPRRWWRLALIFHAATGPGALLVAVAVQTAGPLLLDATLGGGPDPAALRDMSHGIERYGLWVLVGLSPLPGSRRGLCPVCRAWQDIDHDR